MSDFPTKDDWVYSKIDQRFYDAEKKSFVRDALERLYIAIDPGGGAVYTSEQRQAIERRTTMVDALAVELIGGVPSGYEEYT